MDNEQPHQELVKCVVVGDTAVGKTRLICARACNKHVSLSQLLTTHVPTVWAIDQYRIYKDVLERSWEVVDGVNVSLRLWDTFGDHEKDRRFAYGRATRKSDLVMPDQGRALAHEFGIYYYETSVFTYYGVNEVFENAIRAALIARRQQRFWMTNLKRVQRPLLQAPFRPPRPIEPEITIAPSTYLENMNTLLHQQYFADMVIICGAKGFQAHRFILAATSEAFHRLLTTDFANSTCDLARSSSESSMVSSMGEATAGEFNEDTEYLIRQDQSKHLRVWDQIKRRSSCQILPLSDGCKKPPDLYREVNHPAFHSIRIVKCEKIQHAASSTQTIVTMSKLISQQVMRQMLNFIYMGAIDNSVFQQPIPPRLREMYIERSLFADVNFDLDDGIQMAHKAILMARCDPMKAMFQGHFRESTARVISFPGVSMYTFHKLLCYIYTDTVPAIEAPRCLELLELANRLCMNRLVNLVEARVIDDLQHRDRDQDYVVELSLSLLEPVKLHNAHGLADWCMWRLCGAYDRVCRARGLRQLHPDNRDYLSENRWPPVWYLKEYDYYQKCCNEQSKDAKEIRPTTSLQTSQQTGCLCFSSKPRRESDSAPDVMTALCRTEPAAITAPPTPAPPPAPL
ncbi:Rho-related BTB domain-containing protein 1 [Eumeta japonica]|uniref:Rho-related BTB domain-containing protein 1 n=1 Tax=Eumeta variegata TaxID=151549 RepID=A0A4C1VA94_EUMVA|nr:Rho-related BTB domain-containing protein 1 [Eumeta japonica]